MIKQMEQQTLFNSTCFRIICVRQFRILTVMWYLTGIFYGKKTKNKTNKTKQNVVRLTGCKGWTVVHTLMQDWWSLLNVAKVYTNRCTVFAESMIQN